MMTDEEFARLRGHAADNCSEEYKKQKEQALKDRKRSKFVSHKGEFTFTAPAEKNTDENK